MQKYPLHYLILSGNILLAVPNKNDEFFKGVSN